MLSMNRDDVTHGITELIVEVLDLPSNGNNLDTQCEDISGWDSLGHLRIFMAVENRYGIKIPPDDMFAAKSRDDIVDIVFNRLSETI